MIREELNQIDPAAVNLPFAFLVRDQLVELERMLTTIVPHDVPLIGEIYRTLVTGGKRIRPTLTFLSAAIFKPPEPKDAALVRLAAAVELIHTASLLHDDLVDRSPVRRGQPTVSARWGSRAALLAGDYLAATAYRRLALQANTRALPVLADAVVSMCEAELIVLSGKPVDRRTYMALAAGKTGALMGAACQIGAMQANAPMLDSQILRAYGREFGIAFQIVDDLLDLFEEPARTGKPSAQDAIAGQPNLPIIVAAENDSSGRIAQVLRAMREVNSPDAQAMLARELAALVDELGGREQAVDMAKMALARATDCLSRLPATSATAALADAAAWLLSRVPQSA
ncbi:MAG: polyprenyl synthetase family protein [Armatimonadetes bacterium]|nr:polyprenyl synthetase family protein [Armatimonadota bacterium]